MKLSVEQRRAGLFVPVFALRSKDDLGVGDTKSLMTMIDWCARQGFSVLQILPVNETSDDNSPYNAISACALDITTLHLSPETVPGLSVKIYSELCSSLVLQKLRAGSVKYVAVKKLKWELCWQAFENFEKADPREDANGEHEKFERFVSQENAWLADYCLFRTLMEQNGHVPTWEQWQPEHRNPLTARKWVKALPKKEHTAFVRREKFFAFVQWLLFGQWETARAHGDTKGVALMGDIPFGVSRHSVDVWAKPENFDLKWSGGAPPEPFFQPDEFTKVWGQNWGVPVYDWKHMEAERYSWWKRRVFQVSRFFHVFRVDHVLGFYRIYAFPWRPEENGAYVGLSKEQAKKKAGALPQFLPNSDETEASRKANQTHGEALVKMLKEAAGNSIIVGEDLGVVPVYVRPSLEKLGVSGFKIPLFERDEQSREYLPPEKYPALSVSTLATHDHETMAGIWESWWKDYELSQKLGAAKDQKLSEADKELIQKGIYSSWELYRTQRFCGQDDRALMKEFEPKIRESLCRRLLEGNSWLAILMITDLFGMKIRFNVPGPVAESNWSERLPFNIEDIDADGQRQPISRFVSQLIADTGRKTV